MDEGNLNVAHEPAGIVHALTPQSGLQTDPGHSVVAIAGTTQFQTEPWFSATLDAIKLFPSVIDIRNIRQDGVGNCWLMAPLISIARTYGGTQFLKNMMSSTRNSGERILCVRLFKADGSKVILRFNTEAMAGILVRRNVGTLAPKPTCLWPLVIEVALSAFDNKGAFCPHLAKREHLHGGHAQRVATHIFGNQRTLRHKINFSGTLLFAGDTPDFPVSWRYRAFSFAQLTECKLSDQNPADRQQISDIFGPNGQTLLRHWNEWAARHQFAARFKAQLDEINKKISRTETVPDYFPSYRFEDFQALVDRMPSRLNGDTRRCIERWLEINQLFSVKRETLRNARYDLVALNTYDDIVSALVQHRPCTASTHRFIKTPNPSSPGIERMTKGLIGGHEYAIIGAVEQGARCQKWIRLANPWGYYGRSYVPRLQSHDDRLTASDAHAGIFEIDLSDFMKRFCFYSIYETDQLKRP